jgi:hypothetical protein
MPPNSSDAEQHGLGLALDPDVESVAINAAL